MSAEETREKETYTKGSTKEDLEEATSSVSLSWEFLDGGENVVTGVHVYAIRRRPGDEETDDEELEETDGLILEMNVTDEKEKDILGVMRSDPNFILDDNAVSITSVHVGNVDHTSATMKNLIPNSEYTFFILPYIGEEDGSPSNSIDVKMTQVGE